MLIDSHCHVNSKELIADADNLIKAASAAGVDKLIAVGCDFNDSLAAVELAKNYSGVYAAVGVHPSEAFSVLNIDELAGKFDFNFSKLVAVGEIGLDYHFNNSRSVPPEIQQANFIAQLELAKKLNKPVILHIRDAMADALKILHEYADGLKLLFHCYSGGLKFLDEALGFNNSLLAFGGAITWRSKSCDELREALKIVPLNRILFETDSPYLTPEPFRGKQNQPAYVKYVYEAAARVRGVDLNALAAQVEGNFERFIR